MWSEWWLSLEFIEDDSSEYVSPVSTPHLFVKSYLNDTPALTGWRCLISVLPEEVAGAEELFSTTALEDSISSSTFCLESRTEADAGPAYPA